MTNPTPAVERAAAWMYAPAVKPEDLTAVLAPWQLDAAAGALTAALTDPADPDSLARTLFVLYSGYDASDGVRHWSAGPELRRVEWRAVADGLRMMLTGSGS